MNKKTIYIFIFLVVGFSLIILLFGRANIQFQNLFGNNVKKSQQNTLPFVIKSDKKIYVNNKIYDGTRIYREGCYNVRSGFSFKKICINPLEEKNIYNFYVARSTLSILYNAITMAKNETDYSFLYYGRAGTLDIEYLKKINTNIVLSKYTENSTVSEKELSVEIIDEILRILNEDINAYFNFYIEDEMNWLEFTTLAQLGINETRYKVFYINNGTMSYERAYQYYDTYEKYILSEKKVENILDDIRSGREELQDNVVSYIPFLAKRSNTQYYLQYPDYFVTVNEEITNSYQKINFLTDSPKQLYKDLKTDQRKLLHQYLNFDEDELKRKYFSTDKPILIITGNTPIDYNYGNEKFKNLIKQISLDYGKKYKILYKPHPRAIPNEEYQSFFKTHGIDILPGVMPMEAITFVFDDLKFGGFPSSLYMSTDSKDVLFFFAKDAKTLFKPLDSLCKNEFKHVLFINP